MVWKADVPLEKLAASQGAPQAARAQQRPGLTAPTALTGKSPRTVPGPDENAESLQMSQEDAPIPRHWPDQLRQEEPSPLRGSCVAYGLSKP